MIKESFYRGDGPEGPRVVPLFNKATDSYFEKTASACLMPDVVRYISALRPRQDAIYNLVNAMGAGEFYGSNINADWFSEASLTHAPDNWTGNPLVDRVVAEQWPYGYPTFYSAKPYAHHRNKDASRAFGDVELAVWNPRMHRVELVTRVDRDKCHTFGGTAVWDKLVAGQYPDVSMGTRVPWDACSICFDWKLYREAQATFDPRRHKHAGIAVLEFHKTKHKIRGLSVTRADYCFPRGVPILMADGSLREIQDVHVGDQVVSHTGATRRVTALLPSQCDARAVRIHGWGLPPVVATDNHPFLALSKRTPGRGRLGRIARGSFEWVAAGKLEEGDLIKCPVLPVTENEPLDGALGRLLGLYLADGSPCFSTGVPHPKAVCWTFSDTRDDLVREVVAAAVLLDPGCTTRVSRYKDRKAQDIRVNSPIVAEWLLRLGGRGSLQKRVAPQVWRSGTAFCREVLRGWLDGDGSWDASRKLLRGTTSSEVLARQMQMLAASVGVVGALHRTERDSNFGHQVVWYLCFAGDAALAVRESRTQRVFARQSRLILHDGYLLTSVASVVDAGRGEEWFNFEVEEDHSYVAGGYSVHNCSHMKEMQNRILPDGRKVFVYNEYPKFFDISFVFIGADRTAKVMMQVAAGPRNDAPTGSVWMPRSEEELKEVFEGSKKTASVRMDELMRATFGKSAKAKEGEIFKDVIPSQFEGKAISSVTAAEPDLPHEVLDAMGSVPLEQSLSTAASCGVVLRPREFQRVALIRMGHREEADDLETRGCIFPHSEESAPLRLGIGSILPVLARVLSRFEAQRSALSSPLSVRILMVRQLPPRESLVVTSPSTPLLRKLGAAYNAYRAQLPAFMQTVNTPPENIKFATARKPDVISPLSLAYIKTAFLNEVGTAGTNNMAFASVERGYPSRNT